MIPNFRKFEAGPDPFGKVWQVEFGWLQTGIAIRHADTVDVKFFLSDGAQTVEKVVALPHAELLELSQSRHRPLTDPWCSRLAALHIRQMIETGEDFDKTLVTVDPVRLQRYAEMLETAAVPSG